MLIQTDGGSEFTEEECMTWMREVGFDETYVVPLAAKHTAVVGKRHRTYESAKLVAGPVREARPLRAS